MENKISESIFSNADIIIPMADVQHIEKLKYNSAPNGIWIITKHTNWNFEKDMWDNPIYMLERDSKKFIEAWCNYRYEKDIKPFNS